MTEFDCTRGAFLVRVAADRQVVGVFVAADELELWHLIDENVPASRCEYLAVGAGGVCVSQSVPAQWPARFADDGEDIIEADTAPFNGACLSEDWFQACQSGTWVSLAHIDPIEAMGLRTI